jgi:hypothetical protein
MATGSKVSGKGCLAIIFFNLKVKWQKAGNRINPNKAKEVQNGEVMVSE